MLSIHPIFLMIELHRNQKKNQIIILKTLQDFKMF